MIRIKAERELVGSELLDVLYNFKKWLTTLLPHESECYFSVPLFLEYVQLYQCQICLKTLHFKITILSECFSLSLSELLI